jgi:hypothetical protein
MTLLQMRATKVVLSGVVLFVACGFADVVPSNDPLGPITVLNPSFEILPSVGLSHACGTGCFFSVGLIPDWNSSAPLSSGQFQPGTQDGNFRNFSALSNGITSAYSNGRSSIISQTVGATVEVGVPYVLMVDLGQRNNFFLGFRASADLLINGVKYMATGTPPTRGHWSTFTATYTGLSKDVGDSITIQLNGNGAQANFDNVRLDAVPEPSFYGVVGIGLAGLLAFARRKRGA